MIPVHRISGNITVSRARRVYFWVTNTRKRFIFTRQFNRIDEDLNAQIEDLEFMFNSLISSNSKNRGGTKNG